MRAGAISTAPRLATKAKHDEHQHSYDRSQDGCGRFCVVLPRYRQLNHAIEAQITIAQRVEKATFVREAEYIEHWNRHNQCRRDPLAPCRASAGRDSFFSHNVHSLFKPICMPQDCAHHDLRVFLSRN
jgi:hypothetical protein